MPSKALRLRDFDSHLAMDKLSGGIFPRPHEISGSGGYRDQSQRSMRRATRS